MYRATMTTAVTLGATIRRLRTRLGYSQEAVARAVGVTAGMAGKWERDEAVPQHENLLALARVLKVEPSELGYDPEAPLGVVAPQWAVEMEQRAIQRHEQTMQALEIIRKQQKGRP